MSIETFKQILRGEHRYILRIPHRAKSKDRKADNVLSYTWTYDFDPMKALCPREISQGTCSDRQCPWQHLGTMKVFNKAHALAVADIIKSIAMTNDEGSPAPPDVRREVEKIVVAAKLEIHETGKPINYERIICKLIVRLFPTPRRCPYSMPPSSFSGHTGLPSLQTSLPAPASVVAQTAPIQVPALSVCTPPVVKKVLQFASDNHIRAAQQQQERSQEEVRPPQSEQQQNNNPPNSSFTPQHPPSKTFASRLTLSPETVQE